MPGFLIVINVTQVHYAQGAQGHCQRPGGIGGSH